jgi:imidazolonepropionase-like amidohydrolase
MPAATQRLVLTGGTVIDGSGGPPRPDTTVVVEAGEIVAVTPSDATQPGAAGDRADELIDCRGQWVLPGLIDAHCHSTFGEPASNDELFFHRPQSTSAFLAAHNVGKLLRAGVTGFLDPDCIFDLGPALRDAIEAGLVEGPRMRAGMSALLTTAGGTAGRLIPDRGRLAYAQVVGDRDEMVRATREQIKHGADWVKIHVTGLLPGRSGEHSVWRDDELRAVVETAHALDTPVVAHCRSAGSTTQAARAGVDLVLHASFMDEEALEAVVTAGIALCPTFTFLANLCDHGHRVGAASAQVDLFRGEIAATAAMVRRAHDAGVPLLCGSESGFSLTPYGHWHAREIELFVTEVGLDPLAAIRCATANGALALREPPGRVGVVAEGGLADLLVVDADPTVDVGVLGDRSRLTAVVSRGQRVDLERPWPRRSALPGEHVGTWSTALLTRELVDGAGT